MSEKLKKYSWLINLAVNLALYAFMLGGAWMEVKATQRQLAAEISRVSEALKEHMSRQDGDDRDHAKERAEVKELLGRLEERLKGVQEQLARISR